MCRGEGWAPVWIFPSCPHLRQWVVCMKNWTRWLWEAHLSSSSLGEKALPMISGHLFVPSRQDKMFHLNSGQMTMVGTWFRGQAHFLLGANSAHSLGKPLSPLVTWKLMALHFRNYNGIKTWKIFNNGNQTSPTSTLQKHFKHEHLDIWKSECHCLKVPQHDIVKRVLGPTVEPFTRDATMMQLQKFIVSNDEVCF